MSQQWITWAGGARPVSREAFVDVQLRNGAFLRSCYATALDWTHLPGRNSDVVLFRFSEPTNPALAEAETPTIEPGDESCLQRDLTFDEFERNWIEAVARLQAAHIHFTEQMTAALWNVGNKVREITKQQTEMERTFAVRISHDGHTAEELREISRAIAESMRRASEAKTNPEKESAPEIPSESKAEVQSDFDVMAELICRQILVFGFENDADAETAIMAHKATTAIYLRAQFEKMMRQPTADLRERHIMSLWDRAQTIVLDGVAYRTDGIDHVPRRA